MTRDPLQTMLKLRQATLDEAQRGVAEAYEVERETTLRADAAVEVLDREMRAATNLSGGDDAVETFARWLPVGRQALRQAHDAQRDATTALDRARAVLALARAGVRAVETLIEQRQENQRLDQSRREQLVLDEIARARPDTGSGGTV